MADKVDIDSSDSWEEAIKVARHLFEMPPRVLLPIRLLWRHYLAAGKTDRDEKVDPAAYASIRLIDNTISFKAPLYFAASQLRPARFDMAEDDTSKALLRTLGPGLFSVLLSLVWLYRRGAKLAPADQWYTYAPRVLANTELGFVLADASPVIPTPDGVLIGAIRYMSLGGMLVENKRHFQKYANLHIRHGKLDHLDEHKRWECDHTQVATSLLQWYTFTRSGLAERRDLEAPLYVRRALLGLVDEIPETLGELVVWAKFTCTLNQMNRHQSSNQVDLSWLEIDQGKVNEIHERINHIFQNGSTFTWLKRGAKDMEEMREQEHDRHGGDDIAVADEVDTPDLSEEVESEEGPETVHKDIDGFTDEELAGLDQEELEKLQEFAEMVKK